jgi:tripartite-type tricarboxylate transporter receptor subunit TctC
MSPLRKTISTIVLGVWSVIASAADQPYPAHEIRMIVPWASGGSTDIAARFLQKLVAEDGFRLIVENVPGASATIGLTRVANAAPDGYVIGMGTSSTLSLAAQGLTPLRVDQFTSIANASTDPLLLLVPASGGAPTLGAFLEQMKQNPGKVSMGTSGNNNITHIFCIMTAQAAGTGFIHVPYPGGARVVTDLVGKHIQAAVLKPSESKSQIDAGLARPIATFSQKRLSWYPDVPTFKEKGFDVFPHGPVTQMSYVVAPAGLPPPIREKLIAVFRKAIQSPQYKAFADQNGFYVDDLNGVALEAELVSMQKAFNTMGTKIFKPE